ncbi:MAG: response regulator transcription factor [Gammaproteobacteria bacterium]|uniref:response regulator transcription factor n=1 Tax=Rhodoferax sp. TaxID=50421 RepID=UPI0017F61357|nr:response regulator transcription factor [Rhodoferax sp.]MBU3899991.1 response regulator transcription factor [Gammaproteobacteria bacterium]MBA3059696.1 response regulator transcription factor [Rhodoferax sp.]MBU3997535.1 response regulator transcription factor [Gammaproteobacteria bacterium]MBU4017567.1 response regulator transcription factor [Gammaproteobacteria bacterium]MBU4081792.1 response regulator transcription factor [Gammaproteobacteria bacterium]
MPKNPDPQRPVVLVVDDDPNSLGMLCDTLEGEGYTVLVARDGAAALTRLELVVPDAILLDAVMPGLSGFETCSLIKANPVVAHIPVIFMTGLSETEHVLEGFACGGVDYVVKPLRAPELVARLQTHTRNARITRLARDAVDVAGLGVVLVDASGRVAWRSPQASSWLKTVGGTTDDGRLSNALIGALGGDAEPFICTLAGLQLSIRNMGQVGIGETMLLLEQGHASATTPSRLASAALTPRETEVLSWLAKGKTNRDIGDILGMSHRTANKHLEHIFEKLGVETRAAATALAIEHHVG